MNLEIANRLVKLRKENHLSQEQLAEKIGISRQAVSKWERAEASPDTDNLILLARLYHISLDELLKTEEPVEAAEQPEIKDADVSEQSVTLCCPGWKTENAEYENRNVARNENAACHPTAMTERHFLPSQRA